MDERFGPSRWLPWVIAIVAAVIAATVAYNAGLSQGLAGQAAGAATVYRGRGFSPLWLLFGLFWFFAIFRGCWWGGPRYWGYRRYYRGHGPWDEDVPPDFDEWHRRAHEREKNGAPRPSGG